MTGMPLDRADDPLPHMTVDRESGAIYVKVRDGEQMTTRQLTEDHLIFADYDSSDNLLGVEILP